MTQALERTNLVANDTYVSTTAKALAEGQSLADVPGLLVKIIEGELWRERIVRQTGKEATFNSFREFVEAYPPEGLHTTLPDLVAICRLYKGQRAVELILELHPELMTTYDKNQMQYLAILTGGIDPTIYQVSTTYDLLTWAAPPTELLEALQRQEQRGTVPEATAAWAAKWRALQVAEVGK